MGNSVRKNHNASGSNGGTKNSQSTNTVFYSEKNLHHSAQRTISSSSIGTSSNCSWVTAQENTFETTLQSLADLDNLEDFSDPSGTLSNLLAQAGEDDFMKTVLSFCSYMEGRIDKLDNVCLYDEFRLYTTTKSCSNSLTNSLEIGVDLTQEAGMHAVF